MSPLSEVILKNSTADMRLDQCDGLSISPLGKLIARNDRAFCRLTQAVVKACNSSKGDAIGGATKLLVPKQSGKDDYLLDISPLKDTDGELEHGLVGALITVIDVETQRRISLDGLTKLYGLTRAEEKIAELFVQGKKYHEMAEIRNVSPETIKTQINSILTKTGSNSRSELFARVFKINLPLE